MAWPPQLELHHGGGHSQDGLWNIPLVLIGCFWGKDNNEFVAEARKRKNLQNPRGFCGQMAIVKGRDCINWYYVFLGLSQQPRPRANWKRYKKDKRFGNHHVEARGQVTQVARSVDAAPQGIWQSNCKMKIKKSSRWLFLIVCDTGLGTSLKILWWSVVECNVLLGIVAIFELQKKFELPVIFPNMGFDIVCTSIQKSGRDFLLQILTWKCAWRLNGFFTIPTPKKGPFWLGNVLRATVACTFLTFKLVQLCFEAGSQFRFLIVLRSWVFCAV